MPNHQLKGTATRRWRATYNYMKIFLNLKSDQFNFRGLGTNGSDHLLYVAQQLRLYTFKPRRGAGDEVEAGWSHFSKKRDKATSKGQ